MNFQKTYFLKSAAFENQYPNDFIPEIALVGRSNVGKSSFINYICQNKKLAKTSSEPGKTQVINFYFVDKKIRIVDLPGYGYANKSKIKIEKWSKMTDLFLNTRKNLKAIIMVVDIRRVTQSDKMMVEWIKNSRKTLIVIANKLDKIKKSKIEENTDNIKKELALNQSLNLILVSSKCSIGKNQFINLIKKYCN